MPDVSFTNLLIVSAIAVLAPLTVGFLPRLRIPTVVLEIVAGGIPAHGNQRSEWDAGCRFDFFNPEYRLPRHVSAWARPGSTGQAGVVGEQRDLGTVVEVELVEYP
jgi:hypothetical protein